MQYFLRRYICPIFKNRCVGWGKAKELLVKAIKFQLENGRERGGLLLLLHTFWQFLSTAAAVTAAAEASVKEDRIPFGSEYKVF